MLLNCSDNIDKPETPVDPGDGNENIVPTPIEDQFNGVYKGTLDVKLGEPLNSSITDIPQKLYITKNGNNQFKIELKDFSFESMEIGDIVLENVKVTPITATECSFEGQSKISLFMGECQASLTGTIVNNNADISIKVEVAEMSMVVDIKFKGVKLEADQSSQASILKFEINSPVVASTPIIDGENITFIVSEEATAEELGQLAPTITISDKATITPKSGEAQDFSKPVTYTVVSEDGITTNSYKVWISAKSTKYDFDTWVAGVEGQEPDLTFYEVANGWSSSNTGAHFLKAFGIADRYVVTQSEDAHNGTSAARIETIDTKGQDLFFAKAPKVTSGSLFTGKFVTDIANTLNSTKFGNPFYRKPLKLKGMYKYTPGADYYRCESVSNCHIAQIDPNTTDKCAISAVLYEVSTFDDPDLKECLTGVNIYDTERITAIAKLKDGGAQAQYTPFEIDFEYLKNYDANKKYRLAIICSSSNDGDNFNGAPGSVLYVDSFELISE